MLIITKCLWFPAYPSWLCYGQSFFNMCLLCSHMTFIMLPFCLIISLCSRFVCLSGCTVQVFAIMSFLSISITLECSCLCTWTKQSTHSLNLSSAYIWLAFYISFLCWPSAEMGAFMCLFVLVIVHPVLVILSCSLSHYGSSMPNYGSIHPWSTVFSLHCCSWSWRYERNISVSIYIFIQLGLPVY